MKIYSEKCLERSNIPFGLRDAWEVLLHIENLKKRKCSLIIFLQLKNLSRIYQTKILKQLAQIRILE